MANSKPELKSLEQVSGKILCYSALAVLVYRRTKALRGVKEESGKAKKLSSWYVLEDHSKDLFLGLPSLLAIGDILGLGKVLQKIWDKHQGSSLEHLLSLSYLSQICFYFGFGGILTLIAKMSPQSWRTQPKAKVNIKLRRLMPFLLVNMLGPVFGKLLVGLFTKNGLFAPNGELALGLSRGVGSVVRKDKKLPSMLELAVSNAIFLVVYEVGFHSAHRLFHVPFFYKGFHKIHHEYKAPFALAAAFAHPVEHVVANVLPGLVGYFLLRPHVVTMNTLAILGLVQTLIDHSGFACFEPHHDIHHERFNCNYGSLYILDKYFGSYKQH